MSKSLLLTFISILGLSFGLVPTAEASTLSVGPDQSYKAPSAAAMDAKDGDTVEIEPGEYYDCATWHANHLTIVGTGPDVVITDTTCDGKAIFVTAGDDITIRNLTLTRARVPDGNGAGIRAEGKGLTVQDTRFINNEAGIMAADSSASFISLINDDFTANGKCARSCAHALYIGHVAVLHVEHSRFTGTKFADNIFSNAAWTELTDNEIRDGSDGTSSYLVDLPDGGSLVMKGNVVEKGPNTTNPQSAVQIGGGSTPQPTAEITLSDNKFINDMGSSTIFVRNWTGVDATSEDNTIQGDAVEISTSGGMWHRVRQAVRSWNDEFHTIAGKIINHL